jgi:hypothetical protein
MLVGLRIYEGHKIAEVENLMVYAPHWRMPTHDWNEYLLNWCMSANDNYAGKPAPEAA